MCTTIIIYLSQLPHPAITLVMVNSTWWGCTCGTIQYGSPSVAAPHWICIRGDLFRQSTRPAPGIYMNNPPSDPVLPAFYCRGWCNPWYKKRTAVLRVRNGRRILMGIIKGLEAKSKNLLCSVLEFQQKWVDCLINIKSYFLIHDESRGGGDRKARQRYWKYLWR